MLYSKRGNECKPQTIALTSNKKYIMPYNNIYYKYPKCTNNHIYQYVKHDLIKSNKK